MGPQPQGASRRGPVSAADTKGSVRRAREQLEAGVHQAPPENRPPQSKTVAHQSQWPLPPAGIQPNTLNAGQDPRFLAPRGPPPRRPPRPSEVPIPAPRVPSQAPSQPPSPSIYSRSGASPEPNPHYPFPSRHRSFSLPGGPLRASSRPLTSDGSVSPSTTMDGTPRISIATDDTSRHSLGSASSSTVPYPLLLRQADPRKSNGSLAPPNNFNARHSGGARRVSVSPIPEELSSASERATTLDSSGSKGVFPASWGSGPAESEILGAYLDDSSGDEDEHHGTADQHATQDESSLVRSASLGKMQKPTVRTITKSTPTSEASLPQKPTLSVNTGKAQQTAGVKTAMGLAVRDATQPTQPSPLSRVSTSSQSGESYVDPAKPRIAKPTEAEYHSAWEKEIMGGLPAPAPTMSVKRPGGRKPPRLDMGAVRDAEHRGSLSSMTDLIKRATRLATNLEHGRTASKGNVLENVTPGADFRELGLRGRNSGSLSDILNSFPNPVITPDVRSSWPVFFGRSNPRGEPLSSYDETDPSEKKPLQRKCCGLPRRWFIVLCVLLFVIVVLAVLLPVFLVAVPREKASGSCAETNPCKNGGVSVSGGSECSCVCAGGFTGAQCTMDGDSSCVTSAVNRGSVQSNATMGSTLPGIFGQSQEKFQIGLDPVTIMALFSMNNISCRTENALVSFDKVHVNEAAANRRWVVEKEQIPQPTASFAIVARAEETSNGGIVYDGGNDGKNGLNSAATTDTSGPKRTAVAGPATTATDTDESHTTDTATGTNTSTAATSTSTKSSSTSGVPLEVIEFSQAAIMLILQQTGSFDSAQYAESEMQTYLVDSYPAAAHPSVDVLGQYAVDFEKKTITAK